MQASFWHKRWAERRINFHQESVSPMLAQHWVALAIAAETPVLVPLCGKSQDMIWLNQRGHPVLGVELSRTAIEEFNEENALDGQWKTLDGFDLFQSGSIQIWCADFFALGAAQLGPVHAIFDRAALIALPIEMREQYSHHIQTLSAKHCQQLLICLEYDQTKRNGPPFAVLEHEVRSLYPNWQHKLLDREIVEHKQPESHDSAYYLQCVI